MIVQLDNNIIPKIPHQHLMPVRVKTNLFISSNLCFSGLLGRSNSYNGLHSTQGQPRVISAKQRNTSGSSLLYQVNIHVSVTHNVTA